MGIRLGALSPPASQPSELQELLLTAALFSGAAAGDAWETWKCKISLDDIVYGSFRLLPLLYKNLRANGIEDGLMPRLKGIYRYSWVRNRRSLAVLAEVVEKLRSSGISAALLKGGALIATAYRDHGARYMDDVDFFVPFDQAPRAISLLQEWGWWSTYPIPRLFRPYVNALNLDHACGIGIDLHWHLLTQRCNPQDDASYWQSMRPIEFGDRSVLVLDPADQFLHTCVNAAYWSGFANPSWVADAFWQVKALGDQIDWDRLLNTAAKLQLSLPLFVTLSYLRKKFLPEIPARLLEGLGGLPRDKREFREYRSSSKARPWLSELAPLWQRFHRHEVSRHWLKPWAFLKFLQDYCGLNHLWELPGDLAKRFLPRAKKNLAKRAHDHKKIKEAASTA